MFLLIIFLYYTNIYYNFANNIINYKSFINDCLNLKKYNSLNYFNGNNPYLSICIPTFNMEKYIDKALISIINQSFKNLEIIVVDDYSSDNTKKIILNWQSRDNRIRLLKNFENFGVYYSRKYAALNSNGKYILFMDPDDMIVNPHLFEELNIYNLKYNLDMVEFSVFHKQEKKKKIYYSFFHKFNHYHNYKKNIINQPELSNILFYIPNTKNYTALFCRTVWNKLIRKKALIKTIEYIDNFEQKPYLITADDTQMNILNFNYAHNYSNLKLPGYLYNVRKNSMSRTGLEKDHDITICYNFLFYYKLFYKYLKDFKKDLNFLFYDLKSNYFFIFKLKDLNETSYISEIFLFLKEIINDDISINFKNFIKNISLQILN